MGLRAESNPSLDFFDFQHDAPLVAHAAATASQRIAPNSRRFRARPTYFDPLAQPAGHYGVDPLEIHYTGIGIAHAIPLGADLERYAVPVQARGDVEAAARFHELGTARDLAAARGAARLRARDRDRLPGVDERTVALQHPERLRHAGLPRRAAV